jgi:hypothetical protein
MPRKLSNLATAFSLFVLCAVTVLWVRGYWTADLVGVTEQVPTPASRVVWSANGQIVYRLLASPAGSSAVYQSPGWVFGHAPSTEVHSVEFGPNVYRFLGVSFSDNTWNRGPRDPLNGERQVLLRVPFWLVWIAAAALAIALLASRWHRRRVEHLAGVCAACGYDLRATPERCPECGTVPAARSTRTAAA